MQPSIKSRNFMLAVVFGLILISCNYLLLPEFSKIKKNRVEKYQLGGYVNSIEGLVIYATGRLIDQNGEENENTINAEIYLTDSVAIKRIAVIIPKGLSHFNTDELDEEVSRVTLDDMKKDMGGNLLGIKAEVTIKDADLFKFNSSYIEYRVPIFK
jgi:hypothetical protein